jgi:hypothetical protein
MVDEVDFEVGDVCDDARLGVGAWGESITRARHQPSSPSAEDRST